MLTQDDLQKISKLLKVETNPIKDNLEELRKDFKKQGKDIKQIKKSLGTAIDYFDKVMLEIAENWIKLKNASELPQNNFDPVCTSLTD